MNPFLNTIHSILSISHLLVEKRRLPLSYQPSVPFFNKTLKTASFLYSIYGHCRFMNADWQPLYKSSVVLLRSWALISWSRWITYKLYDQCRKIHCKKATYVLPVINLLGSYVCLYLMKCQIQWGLHLFASVLLMRCVHEKQTHSSQITVRCSRKHVHTGLCKNRQEQEQAAFTSLELSKQPSSLALFTMGLMLIV